MAQQIRNVAIKVFNFCRMHNGPEKSKHFVPDETHTLSQVQKLWHVASTTSIDDCSRVLQPNRVSNHKNWVYFQTWVNQTSLITPFNRFTTVNKIMYFNFPCYKEIWLKMTFPRVPSKDVFWTLGKVIFWAKFLYRPIISLQSWNK